MDFFYRPDAPLFRITPEHEEVIRNLKFEIETDGGYYDCQPRWSLKINKIPDNLSLSDIHRAMQFITMTADIDGDIPNHFRDLLRRSYIDHYDSQNSLDGEESISLGYKRPFGNSHVLGDVREVMVDCGFYPGKTHEDFYNESGEREDYTNEEVELRKFVEFLTNDFFKNFKVKYRSFVFQNRRSTVFNQDDYEYWTDKLDTTHHILHNWILDPAEVRDEKLDKILDGGL